MLAFKLFFVLSAILVFFLGIVFLRNFEAWFGVDPGVPSENESARFLNKTQLVVVWLLSLKLCVMMIFVI